MASRTVRFFPEINDEQSSHLDSSPLTDIIQNLKRKNAVTAAATSGSQMSLLDTSDPWGTTESSQEDRPAAPANQATLCNCQSRARRRGSMEFSSPRTLFGYSSPQRNSLNTRQMITRESFMFSESNHYGTSPGICGDCGREKGLVGDMEGINGMPPRTPRQIRLNSWLESARKERQHAKALLLATPDLRIISQASTDMQGAGGVASKGLLGFILPSSASSGSAADGSGGPGGLMSDYRTSLVRDRANQQAAAELSSLLWILAHEMSLEDYGTVENEVFTAVFALVHSQDNKRRIAGLCALDALIDAPSSDEEKKAIKFANTLSNGLRSAHGDYEFLSAVSKALGHMATRTVNIDFVEAEVVRALEWLRTDRSDRRYVINMSSAIVYGRRMSQT
jgi:hypothetical protein